MRENTFIFFACKICRCLFVYISCVFVAATQVAHSAHVAGSGGTRGAGHACVYADSRHLQRNASHYFFQGKSPNKKNICVQFLLIFVICEVNYVMG